MTVHIIVCVILWGGAVGYSLDGLSYQDGFMFFGAFVYSAATFMIYTHKKTIKKLWKASLI